MVALLKPKFNDVQIVSLVQKALDEDPLLDVTSVKVGSDQGVVMLQGRLARAGTRQHVELVVEQALTRAGIKFTRIVNELT